MMMYKICLVTLLSCVLTQASPVVQHHGHTAGVALVSNSKSGKIIVYYAIRAGKSTMQTAGKIITRAEAEGVNPTVWNGLFPLPRSVYSYSLHLREKFDFHKTKSGTYREVQTVHPPPAENHAEMARFIVNQADWASLATISTQEGIVSYPIAAIKSISDGPRGNGTGVPYLFLSPKTYSDRDLAADSRASLVVSLAQGAYCKENNYDAMDHRCGRVVITGRVVKIEETTPEYAVARAAFFARHPALAHMPKDHGFFFAKMNIERLSVLASFGPFHVVSAQDYFNATVAQRQV